MKHVTEHTGTLLAHDSAGAKYSIDVYTRFMHVQTLDGLTHKTAGTRALKLAGKHVNVLDSQHVQVVESGLTLTLEHEIQP